MTSGTVRPWPERPETSTMTRSPWRRPVGSTPAPVMLKNRLPTETPFDSAPGEATVVPRTVTVRHRALPRLMNFASASRPTIQRVWPAVGAAVTPVASTRIAPASFSM